MWYRKKSQVKIVAALAVLGSSFLADLTAASTFPFALLL